MSWERREGESREAIGFFSLVLFMHYSERNNIF